MPDEKPSMYERTEYEIISETETESGITGVIRNICNGALIECRIPQRKKKNLPLTSHMR